MVRKLQLWRELSAEEQQAVLSLPYEIAVYEHGKYIVREGEHAEHTCLLLDGFAYRQKLTADGARSINALHMRGDIVDLQVSLLSQADHSVQALTRSKIARIPVRSVIELAFARPNVGMAMWYDTLVDASIFREWILNIARREAKARLAHVLCEFGLRLEALGLGKRSHYHLPLTQEHLADVTGLTPVHVNRSLKALRDEGLIEAHVRNIRIADWSALREAGGFNEAYLHLSRGGRSPVI